VLEITENRSAPRCVYEKFEETVAKGCIRKPQIEEQIIQWPNENGQNDKP